MFQIELYLEIIFPFPKSEKSLKAPLAVARMGTL